jgi:hypothetical protein
MVRDEALLTELLRSIKPADAERVKHILQYMPAGRQVSLGLIELRLRLVAFFERINTKLVELSTEMDSILLEGLTADLQDLRDNIEMYLPELASGLEAILQNDTLDATRSAIVAGTELSVRQLLTDNADLDEATVRAACQETTDAVIECLWEVVNVVDGFAAQQERMTSDPALHSLRLHIEDQFRVGRQEIEFALDNLALHGHSSRNEGVA